MLSQRQIDRLVRTHLDTGASPELINGTKKYYLFYSSDDSDLVDDLKSIEPYAPHWPVNEGVLGTSKLVYARILGDLINDRGGSVNMIYGQSVS